MNNNRNKNIHDNNSNSNNHNNNHNNNKNVTNNKYDHLKEELKHLNRRIGILQESIQLSSISTALYNPKTWQDNCLNAVQNCVHEWRHILSFHQSQLVDIHQEVALYHDQDKFQEDHDDDDNDDENDLVSQEQEQNKKQNVITTTSRPPNKSSDEDDDMDNERHQLRVAIQSTALKLFGLIQMAMQVGPLKGSNPGYFKRCGVDVAKMAQQFLNECVYGKSSDANHDQNNAIRSSETSDNNNETKSHGQENCKDDDDEEEESMLQSQPQPQPHILISELRFTERQKDIITKWMNNADKAVKANKLPSKSALKLQQSSKSKKSEKKMSNLKKKKKK